MSRPRPPTLPDAPNIIDGELRAGSLGCDERRSPGHRPAGRHVRAAPTQRDVAGAVARRARGAAGMGRSAPSSSVGWSCAGRAGARGAWRRARGPRASRRPASRGGTRSGETGGAIEMGFFVAGEGRRFYGQTTTSAVPNKSAHGRAPAARRRRPDHRGQHADRQRRLEGRFPRCCAATRRSSRPPRTRRCQRWAFGAARPRGRRARRRLHSCTASARKPAPPLVEHPDVDVISFTGSCAVGRWIAATAGRRLVKTCLELGGKNPLIVCDDADLRTRCRRRPALGVQQRRPALRRRQPHHRVRRGLRRVQGAAGGRGPAG